MRSFIDRQRGIYYVQVFWDEVVGIEPWRQAVRSNDPFWYMSKIMDLIRSQLTMRGGFIESFDESFDAREYVKVIILASRVDMPEFTREALYKVEEFRDDLLLRNCHEDNFRADIVAPCPNCRLVCTLSERRMGQVPKFYHRLPFLCESCFVDLPPPVENGRCH